MGGSNVSDNSIYMISSCFQETQHVAPPRSSSLELPCHVDSFPAASRGPECWETFLDDSGWGAKTPTLRKNKPLDSGPDKKKRKDWEMEPNLRDGISGDIYHTVMGIPTSNKKTESLLSPASLEKSTDYAPNKDHPKHGDKKVLVSVWTTQSV